MLHQFRSYQSEVRNHLLFSDFVSPELVEGRIPNSDFRPLLTNCAIAKPMTNTAGSQQQRP